MIVIDSSVVVAGLADPGDARRVLEEEDLAAPHLLDVEIGHAFRGLVFRDRLSVSRAQVLLERWCAMSISRFPAVDLLPRVWDLRDNLTAYDATYVALAESLDVALVTGDARIAGAPDLRCSVVVV